MTTDPRTPDVAAFKARHPEFAGMPEPTVQINLDDAEAYMLPVEQWGTGVYPRAICLLAAHYLSLGQRAAAGGGPGVVVSRKEGDLSETYAHPTAGGDGLAEYWASTLYGRAWWALFAASGISLLSRFVV